MRTNKNINCAIYARLSKEDGYDSKSISIENQIEICKKYAIEHNLVTMKIIYDDGYSGTNFNRPGFNELLSLIDNKEINCILIKDLSRFGRNFLGVSSYVEDILPSKEIRLISINDNYDSENTEDEELCVAIRNFLNGYYAKECAKKMKIAKETIAKRRTTSSVGVYGYQVSKANNERKLIIDEEAASIVKKIFNLFINGKSVKQIQEYLMDNKIMSMGNYKMKKNKTLKYNVNPNQYQWNIAMITRVLRDRHYIGDTINNKGKENEIIIENTHKAIITKEDYYKVQKLFRKSDYSNRYKYNDRLYNTVFDDDGRRFYFKKNKTKNKYGIKGLSINADIIHDYVYNDLIKIIKKVRKDKDKFIAYYEKRTESKFKNKELSTLLIKRKNIDLKIQELFEKLALEEIDEISYELDMDIYKMQIKELNEQINNYNIKKSNQDLRKDKFLKFVEDIENINLNKNKVELLRIFVHKIIISKVGDIFEIKIIYNFEI